MFESQLPIPTPITIQDGDAVTTLAKLGETYRLTQDIIENLSDGALKELYDHSEQDLDKVQKTIFDETYNVLYGTGGIVKDTSIKYMTALSNNMEMALRRGNFNYFITSVMPSFQMNWHHIEWGQFIQQFNKLCIIAPRDHGKSFMFSHAYPIWKMYRYKGVRQIGARTVDDVTNHRGFIISNEMGLTEELLEQIAITIEENDELRETLMPPRKDMFNKRSLRCKNGARLSTKSYGSSFRGRHPGYIVADDFLKDNVIYSEVQRRKATDYFHSVIMNAIIPNGQVIVVGTPFHSADLYGDLKQKRGARGWRVFEYPAISPDGKILWPSRYSYEALMDKREAQGNLIFSRELLCTPVVSDSSIFPWDILKRSLVGMSGYTLVKNIDSFPIKFRKVVTGCDLAISGKVGADYSVFSTWGLDDYDRMWLLHCWRGSGRSYKEQINIMRAIHRNFRPDIMVVEANAFQMVLAEMASELGMPVVPHTTTAANKNDLKNGLPGMSLLFERGRILFPYGDDYSRSVADLFLNEFSCVAFTDNGIEGVGEHDDCTMSTFMGRRGFSYAGGEFLGDFL